MLHSYTLSLLLLVVASSLTGLAQSVGALRGQVLDRVEQSCRGLQSR